MSDAPLEAIKELQLVWVSMNDHLARIEALEAQVKELQWWVRPFPGTGGEGAEMVLPKANGDAPPEAAGTG